MGICSQLIAILVLASTGSAALPARLDGLANKLASAADDLAAESYNGFRDRDRGNRADVEALYLVQQFSAGASLFRRMVQDRRPVSELRDSLPILQDQVRSADRFSFGRQAWEDIGHTLDEISREVGSARGHSDDYDESEKRSTGRMHWRGMVDDTVQVSVQGSDVSTRTVRGIQSPNASFNFTSPLPRHRVTVELRKMKGRGTVEVIQQPSHDNDFTAVIEILDPKGGQNEYEFEIIW